MIARESFLALVLFGTLGAGVARAQNFADYYPLGYGWSWKSVNPADPTNDYEYRDILGPITFGGVSGWSLGSDDCNTWYVANDGVTFSWMATVENCVLEDIVPDYGIGAFTDGTWMPWASPNEYILIRDWANIDPVYKPRYGIDPNRPNVVLIAWYDDDNGYLPNIQNDAMESGGIVSFPPGAVTAIEWYELGWGPVGYVDVMAENGLLAPWYDVFRGALAVHRNAGANPDSHQALTRPVLGDTYSASIDLAGTTGHPFAWLAGFLTPLSLSVGGGRILLVNAFDAGGELLLQPAKPGPMAQFDIPIPSDPSLAGVAAYTQALHFGGGSPFALSNAQDLFVGH